MNSEVNVLFPAEGVILRDPAEVERVLADMWKSAGQQATGESGSRAVTRVSVANLIVVAAASRWDALAETLADLSLMAPARMIVLLVSDREPGLPGITASVSALCHLPQEGEAQVCCEQIVLRTGAGQADTLDKTLLPLLESDVPVMCWWQFDPRAAPALLATVQSLAERLIFDAGRAGFEHLPPAGPCTIRELGWYRTYPWREQIARMFDACPTEAPAGIEQVSIQTRGKSPGELIDASWLAAFLAGQLEWQPVQLRSDGPRQTAIEFRSGRGPVRVLLAQNTGPGCGLKGLAIRSGISTFEVQDYPDRPEEYRITICDRHVCQMPRSMQVPAMRTSQALAAALAGRRVDAAFERAWPIAAWMMAAANP